MATEEATEVAEQIVVEEAEITEAEEVEEIEEETSEDEDDGEEQPESEEEQTTEDEGGLVVSLDEDEEDAEVSQPMRDLRQQNRDLKKRLKEIEAAKSVDNLEIGEKPKLEDFDYNTEKFEAALLEWSARKTEVETKTKEREEFAQRQVAEFEEKKALYNAARKKLNVKNFEEAEDVVKSTLPQIVQDVIIDNAKDPALVFYALGKNPKAMEGLSKAETLREAVSAAYKLGAQEAKMKVTGMKNKPKPETKIQGGAKPVKTGERQLEKLREEAAKTGDYTKVHAYKKQLRAS